MNRIRSIKAMMCAGFAGGILSLSCKMFNLLLGHLGMALGSMDKIPALTKWVNALVPAQEWVLWTGVTIFVIGYIWLAWLEEPSPFICVLHGFALLICLISTACTFPWVYVVQGALEDTAKHAPGFSPLRDLPWLILCVLPFIVAVIWSRFRRSSV